jgi:hypothetical protein
MRDLAGNGLPLSRERRSRLHRLTTARPRRSSAAADDAHSALPLPPTHWVGCGAGQRAHAAQEEDRMRFYNRQHRHYCEIDLHVKTCTSACLTPVVRCWCTATSRPRRRRCWKWWLQAQLHLRPRRSKIVATRRAGDAETSKGSPRLPSGLSNRADRSSATVRRSNSCSSIARAL